MDKIEKQTFRHRRRRPKGPSPMVVASHRSPQMSVGSYFSRRPKTGFHIPSRTVIRSVGDGPQKWLRGCCVKWVKQTDEKRLLAIIRELHFLWRF
ncbi:hypothetical protein HanHA300_Chr08g0292491 [Helianthus annuus]|nr:hypothetical protein HanHA300_Chr08g0292491 [Helianthus annuus]KAJ0554684.1 hypothetical protein HanHA89_Chr08g0310971 [Helianthus annuus]KAJ0720247.1 hypothetical protein HanLR1_Chr08g0291261 [Helianthus annuus]